MSFPSATMCSLGSPPEGGGVASGDQGHDRALPSLKSEKLTHRCGRGAVRGPRTHKHPRRSLDQRGRREALQASDVVASNPQAMEVRTSERDKDLSRLKHRLSSHASAPKSPAHGYGCEFPMSRTRSGAGLG